MGSVGAPMGGQVIEVMAEPGGHLHLKLPWGSRMPGCVVFSLLWVQAARCKAY